MIAGKYLYILLLILSSDVLLVWIQGNGYFLVEFSNPNLYWDYFFYRILFACEKFILPLDLVQRFKIIHKNPRRGAVGFTSPGWDPKALLFMSSVLKLLTSSATTDFYFLEMELGLCAVPSLPCPGRTLNKIKIKIKISMALEREKGRIKNGHSALDKRHEHFWSSISGSVICMPTKSSEGVFLQILVVFSCLLLL